MARAIIHHLFADCIKSLPIARRFLTSWASAAEFYSFFNGQPSSSQKNRGHRRISGHVPPGGNAETGDRAGGRKDITAMNRETIERDWKGWAYSGSPEFT